MASEGWREAGFLCWNMRTHSTVRDQMSEAGRKGCGTHLSIPGTDSCHLVKTCPCKWRLMLPCASLCSFFTPETWNRWSYGSHKFRQDFHTLKRKYISHEVRMATKLIVFKSKWNLNSLNSDMKHTRVLDHYWSNIFSLRQEVCRMKMYISDTELKTNPHYKLDHSQYKVPLSRLYVSQGPPEVSAYLKWSCPLFLVQ